MSLFSSLKEFNGAWNTKGTAEPLSAEDIATIASIEVKEGQYGAMVCFNLINGHTRWSAISRDSALTVGDRVDPNSVTILTLCREGDADIYRVDGKKL